MDQGSIGVRSGGASECRAGLGLYDRSTEVKLTLIDWIRSTEVTFFC
jgi:hypothetical protein